MVLKFEDTELYAFQHFLRPKLPLKNPFSVTAFSNIVDWQKPPPSQFGKLELFYSCRQDVNYQ